MHDNGECETCGKNLKKRYDKPPRPQTKWCSRACKKIAHHIDVTCKCCGKSFSVIRARINTVKYCSQECQKNSQTIYKKETKQCSYCSLPVDINKDNRRSNKIYCNKECFDKARKFKKISNCKQCNKEFYSKFKRGSYTKFCSQYCFSESRIDTVTCCNCGNEYNRPAWISKAGRGFNVCSRKCQTEFSVGKNSPNYNDYGRYESSGYMWVRDPNLDNNYGWIPEHRKFVSDHIGRKLKYWSEPILHINGNNTDNRLSNLYVCSNMSEMATILNSYSAPYPHKSNVDSLVVNKIDELESKNV